MKKIGLWWWASMGGLVVVLVLLFVSMGQYNSIKEDLEQCENDSASQLAQSQSSLASLQSQYNAMEDDYQAMSDDYDAVSQELTDLKASSNLNDFASVEELEAWLQANSISNEPWAATYWGWYEKGLRLQQDAAADGYLISVQYHFCDERGILEYIACIAHIDGYLWIWDPELDEVYPDPMFGTGSH